MKNNLIITFLIFYIILFATSAYCQQTKKVLFIGNSFTRYNNMPQTVKKMCDNAKEQVNIEQVTVDGYNLIYYYTYKQDSENTAIEKILSKDWDIVVLQDAPVPLLIPEERKYWYEPAIIKFDSIIKSKHARTFLFQNYSLDNLPFKYCHPSFVVERTARRFDSNISIKTGCCSDSFVNSQHEFDTLEAVTKNIANKIHATTVKVGYAFELYKKKFPATSLYTVGNHPTPIGSYLIACMFYISITGKKANTIKYYSSLTEDTCMQIQSVADMAADLEE